jgi:hypothetical protein
LKKCGGVEPLRRIDLSPHMIPDESLDGTVVGAFDIFRKIAGGKLGIVAVVGEAFATGAFAGAFSSAVALDFVFI